MLGSTIVYQSTHTAADEKEQVIRKRIIFVKKCDEKIFLYALFPYLANFVMFSIICCNIC